MADPAGSAARELAGAVTAALPGADLTEEFDTLTLNLTVSDWVVAADAARAAGAAFFDFLTAVDEDEQGFAVVARLFDPVRGAGIVLRTLTGRDRPEVPSLAERYPGAAWHERHAAEMFGIAFAGHPDLRPLLLAEDFEGHPLRKDFRLASRERLAWPGAVEPGLPAGREPRRRRRPLGET